MFFSIHAGEGLRGNSYLNDLIPLVQLVILPEFILLSSSHHSKALCILSTISQTLDKLYYVYSKVRVNYPAETEGDGERRARRRQKEAASFVNQFPALNTSLEVKQIFCVKIHCFSICISAHGHKKDST